MPLILSKHNIACGNKRRCEAEWTKMDVLAVPTAGTHYTLAQIAEEPFQRNRNLGHYTNFVNLLDLVCAGGTGRVPCRWLARRSDTDRPGQCRSMTVGHRQPLSPREPCARSALRDSHCLLFAARRLRYKQAMKSCLPSSALTFHGLPLNHQLTSRGARLLQTTVTAPAYRLYALPGTVPPKPGLVRVAGGGASITVELWAMSRGRVRIVCRRSAATAGDRHANTGRRAHCKRIFVRILCGFRRAGYFGVRRLAKLISLRRQARSSERRV